MKRYAFMLATLGLGIVIGSAILPSANSNQAVAAVKPGEIEKYKWWENRGSQFVFFAVLEGLYADGVKGDVIDVILPLVTPAPTDANPAPAPYRDTNANFIYMCPLCHPASEAFLLYEQRQPFRGQKSSTLDTFGDGLPVELVRKLKSDKPAVRRDAIQVLIQRWVQRRIERTKMTDDQRLELTIELKLLKAAGLESLEQFKRGRPGDYFRDLYADWKTCPTCEGGFGACAAPEPDKQPDRIPEPEPAAAPPATQPATPAATAEPGAAITVPTPSSLLAERENGTTLDIEFFG